MSRHQYIRNLDYQDAMDEYEGYSEEEDELSPEDRALLSQGTADVQAALGVEASKVTVAQIEEALWHYYYDVDKSVAYLTSKFINPRPKATKPAARQPNGKAPTCAIDPAEADLPLALDAPGYWARKHLDLTDAAPHTSSTSYIPLRTSELLPAPAAIAFERRTSYISHLFRDMPWGNIPKHREATFVPPPMPRGGLLGGSGTAPKMSKLQALAAARKKKAEEKTANKNKPTVADSPAAKTDVPLAGLLNKRLKISEPTPQGRTTPILASAVPESTQPGLPQRRDVAPDIPQDEPIAKSEPSTFAQVLCGLPSDSRKTRTRGQRPLATDELFDVFGLPSDTSEQSPPEDVALATTAQSPAFAQPLGGGIRSRVSNARFRTDETPVDPSLFRKRYGPDNKGKPPKEPFDYTWWFDIRKRKRDDSDGYEEVVVLYPNLPQSARDNFAQPSPDDIVLAAQAKAKGKAGQKAAAAQPKKKGTPSTEAVTAAVNELKVDDAPLPKSRGLDVLSEFEKSKGKKSASFVVVGHVDAGKSTMMGRLLLDLKVVDQRAVDKLRKEAETIGKGSFALAWLLDQRSEERSRGVTIDIATNRFETEHTAFTILDAPGHQDFIPNMIAGASQADFAILVIDASIGAFESGLKGQTKEHSLLIRSMGVSRVIVAVNKLDVVAWSQERFDEIKDQMAGFLSAANFHHKNIAFVPVSGLHGDNLVRRSTDPAAAWYTGPTLVEELENSEPNARALAKPLRMTVSEVYRTMQSPVTVSGRIDAGSLQTGDALLVQPSGEKAYVKSLLVDEAPAEWAVAGQNVVLHLSHIDPIHVRVGDIICDPAKPIPRSDTFTLKALAFDILLPMQVDVHRGRLHAAGRIEAIPALLDKVTGAVVKKKPKIVKPATVARVVVKLEAQVPLEAGQRVVLRSGGQTVAAGLLE